MTTYRDVPIWADDADASWVFTVTPNNPTETLDWASPVVAIGSGAYEVTAEWQGSATPGARQIKIPLSGLTAGRHNLYLRVPNGTDIKIRNTVAVRART